MTRIPALIASLFLIVASANGQASLANPTPYPVQVNVPSPSVGDFYPGTQQEVTIGNVANQPVAIGQPNGTAIGGTAATVTQLQNISISENGPVTNLPSIILTITAPSSGLDTGPIPVLVTIFGSGPNGITMLQGGGYLALVNGDWAFYLTDGWYSNYASNPAAGTVPKVPTVQQINAANGQPQTKNARAHNKPPSKTQGRPVKTKPPKPSASKPTRNDETDPGNSASGGPGQPTNPGTGGTEPVPTGPIGEPPVVPSTNPSNPNTPN